MDDLDQIVNKKQTICAMNKWKALKKPPRVKPQEAGWYNAQRIIFQIVVKQSQLWDSKI